jgi:hypothetical protein
MKMHHALSFAALFAVTTGLVFAEDTIAPKAEAPVVQIAILLDNSGSMSGLITQAKSQLWSIVNEFISAKQDGKAPRVQVALFEYGVNDLGEEVGYIRKLSDLTDDLDKLSEQLFSISTRTSGSQEFCGMVLKDAVDKLDWDKSSKTYKAIFIAGNEPFTQGPVPYASACKSAISKGIIVNTIHCGSDVEGVKGKWQDAAALADGKYLLIDHNAAVAAIAAPQDKEIAQLSSKLNETYVRYGANGLSGKQRQEMQDLNAAAAPAAATVVTARAVAKASANYDNGTWDLVDRAKQKDFDVTKVKDEELPADMRKLTSEEKKDYLAKKTAERTEIQKRIGELAKERDAFVASKTQQASKDSTLGKAVTGAVRAQAEKKGVTFNQ